jgi:hypothetical protein
MTGIVKDTTNHFFVKGKIMFNLSIYCFVPLSPNYYLLLQLWISLSLYPLKNNLATAIRVIPINK